MNSSIHSRAADVSFHFSEHRQASFQELYRSKARLDSILEKAKTESELTFMGALVEASCWPKRMTVGHFCQRKTVLLFSYILITGCISSLSCRIQNLYFCADQDYMDCLGKFPVDAVLGKKKLL